jgi:hypothetical protein
MAEALGGSVRFAPSNRPVARLRVTGRASRLGTKALQKACTALGTDE